MAQELSRKRQFWTDEEDARLVQLVAVNGVHNWTEVADGLRGRDSKSCSLRWRYFLAPHIVRSTEEKLSPWEVAVLFWGLKQHGNKWRTIVDIYLPWRSPSDLKNFSNQHLVLQSKLPQVVAENPYLAAGYSLQDLLAEQPPDIAERWGRVKEMQASTPAGGGAPNKRGTRGLSYILRQAAKLQAQRAAAQPYGRPRAAVKREPAGGSMAVAAPGGSIGAARIDALPAAGQVQVGLLNLAPLQPAAAAAAAGGAVRVGSAGTPAPGAPQQPSVSHASLMAAIRAALAKAGAPATPSTAVGGSTGLLHISFHPAAAPQQPQQQQPQQQPMKGFAMPAASGGMMCSSGSAGLPRSFFPGSFLSSSSTSSFQAPAGMPFSAAAGGSSFSGASSHSAGCSSLDGSPTGAAAEHMSGSSPASELRMPAADAGSFVGWSSLPGLSLAAFASGGSSTGTNTPCGSPHKQPALPLHLAQPQLMQHQLLRAAPAQSQPMGVPGQAALPMQLLPGGLHHPQSLDIHQPQPQPPASLTFQEMLLSDWLPPPPAATQQQQQQQQQASGQAAPAEPAATPPAAGSASDPSLAPAAAPSHDNDANNDQECFAELAQILFGRHATSDDDTLLQAAADAAAGAAFTGSAAAGQPPCVAGAGPACPLLDDAQDPDGSTDDADLDLDFGLLGGFAGWMDLDAPQDAAAAAAPAADSAGASAAALAHASGAVGGAPDKQLQHQQLGGPLQVSPSVTALLEQMDSVEAFRHLPGW